VDLDSSLEDQVASASSISVVLGEPRRQLVVCSGIAITEWESHAHFNPVDVRIKLNVQATALLGWTAVAGLAGVSDDDNDNPFHFTTDWAYAELDEASGEIFLVTRINVFGDSGSLRRFSYQTHLLIDAEQALISGVISWNETVAHEVADPRFSAVPGAGRVAHRFTVTAGTFDDPGTGFHIYRPLVSRNERSVVSTDLGGGERHVPYVLPVPAQLLGTPLMMSASVVPGGMVPATGGQLLSVEQVSGPSPVELTTQHLTETDVNFAVVAQARPR
jgi:hypothetical protein